MPIEFRDYSIEVSAKMKDAAKRFLIEAAHEVTSQTIRTTSPKKQQLRGSWGNSVDENAMTAQIGSPLEESFWNEFGTGSHAIHGDGRKGWWVYIEGQPRGEKNSRVYDSQQEALSILRAAMADMHLPYALGQYRAAPLPETYFVGQWVDAESFTEDGRADSTMTLLGYSRAGLDALLAASKAIQARFPAYGWTCITDSGSGLAISFAGASFLPDIDGAARRISINLNIKEWSVDET